MPIGEGCVSRPEDFAHGQRQWVMLLLFFFPGCALLNNTTKTLSTGGTAKEKNTSLKVTENASAESRLHSITFIKDSAGIDFRLEIWPKGNFTYSIGNGFSGTAEKVVLSAKGLQTRVALQQQIQSQHAEVLKTKDLQQKEVQKSNTRVLEKVSSVSWKWVGAGLLVLLLAIGLGFRFRNRSGPHNK